MSPKTARGQASCSPGGPRKWYLRGGNVGAPDLKWGVTNLDFRETLWRLCWHRLRGQSGGRESCQAATRANHEDHA